MDSFISNIQSSTVLVDADVRFIVCTDHDDTTDPVSALLQAGTFPLPRLFEVLTRCISGGGRVIDLGAHVGSFTLSAAAAGYEVLSIEASPPNAELIRRSIDANGFTNVRLENIAISDRDGALQFHCRGPYGHLATGGEMGNASVEATTLDKLLARIGWDRVDFIKMDIEGSEVAALRGMQATIATSRPVIFCESNGHMLNVFGETPQTLKQALVDFGYSLFLVEPDSLVPASAQDVQGCTVVDYLACGPLPPALASRAAAVGAQAYRNTMAELVATAQSPNADVRRYAARALRDADAALRATEGAAELCALLRRDADEGVRTVAAEIPAPAPARKAWWRWPF